MIYLIATVHKHYIFINKTRNIIMFNQNSRKCIEIYHYVNIDNSYVHRMQFKCEGYNVYKIQVQVMKCLSFTRPRSIALVGVQYSD